MGGYFSERLSARDNLFLVAETNATPMHIAAVQIVEAGPLRRHDGGIDSGRLTQALESVLHLIPHYRQKLRSLRGARPVWVDDADFDLDYHVRHVRLPQPGTPEQLKCEAARILERPLDRGRPLWELWVVEGLAADEQFALVSKIHHCMLDGMAGADLAALLASPDPEAEPGPPEPFRPRPAPSSLEQIKDEWRARAQAALRSGARLAERGAVGPRARDAAHRIAAIRTLAAQALRPVSATSLNGRTSPERSVEWLTLPLGEVREARKVLSCTVNDLVLATLAGGLRSYLMRRGSDPARLDLRAATPVNMRSELDRGKPGNFVSSWIVSLPLGEPSAAERLATICRTTLELKQARAELAIDTLFGISEVLPEQVLSLALRAAPRSANLLVTNVPGPQFPLYQLGARLLGIYPLAPCLPGSGLAVALFSYDGKLCWGFNADRALVPDLPELTREIEAAHRELAALALPEPARARSESTPCGVGLHWCRHEMPLSVGPEAETSSGRPRSRRSTSTTRSP